MSLKQSMLKSFDAKAVIKFEGLDKSSVASDVFKLVQHYLNYNLSHQIMIDTVNTTIYIGRKI